MLDSEKVQDVVEIPVLVQFAQKGGTVYQGQFTGVYKRIEQPRIDFLMDNDNGYTVSEVVEEILIGVPDIGKAGVAMSSEEGLAWVKKQPECVQAAYAAFFKAMRPERYNEKTSKRTRGRG